MTILKTVVETQPALQALALLKFRKTSQGFKLATYMRKLGEHFATYEKSRLDLLKEYGTEHDEGRKYQVSNENLPAFTEAHDELLAVEVDGLTPPTITLAEDLKEDIEFKPWELYPLWGNVITKVDSQQSMIELTRNEVLVTVSGVRSLGAVKMKNLQLAYKVLNNLAVLTPIITKFQEEEEAIPAGTPEEQGAALQALYTADKVSYSLVKFTLDELDGLELEPAILLQLEPLISV